MTVQESIDIFTLKLERLENYNLNKDDYTKFSIIKHKTKSITDKELETYPEILDSYNSKLKDIEINYLN